MRRSLVFLLFVVGCGGGSSIHPVDGVVLHPDGTPATELAGFHVEFESTDAKIDGRPASAVGTLDKTARFKLTTKTPGDGAMAGNHRVLIAQPNPVGDTPAKPFVVDPKYLSYQTSGLTATVEPRPNQIKIEVMKRK